MHPSASRQEIFQIKRLLESNNLDNYQLGLQLLVGFEILPMEAVDWLDNYKKETYRATPLQIAYKKGKISCSIRLERTTFEVLPPWFNAISSLVSLELVSAKLKTLPKNWTAWPKLERLMISECRELSGKGIQHLNTTVNLKILNLTACGISEFSPAFLEMPALEVLYLGYNKIASLPKTTGQLQELTYLELKNNQLQQIPYQWLELKNLGYLDVENNPLLEPQKTFLKRYKATKVIKY